MGIYRKEETPVTQITKPRVDRNRPLSVEVDHPHSETTDISWLFVRDLVTDMTYQRALDPAKVFKIATNFDPDAFGALVISRRDNGTLAVIDGAHRVAAMYDIGYDDQKVPAVVYRGLTIEDEARIFATLNSNRTKPKPQDIHKAQVAAGDPQAIEIQEIFDNYGISVTINPKGEGLRPIGTINRLYKFGGGNLINNLLWVLMEAYDNDKSVEVFYHDTMTSLGAIIHRYPKIDLRRLANALSSMGLPQKAYLRGKSIANVTNTKAVNETANQILAVYNKGLRSNRLEVFHPTANLFK